MFIWIFHNLPPQLRYKKRFLIPAKCHPWPEQARRYWFLSIPFTVSCSCTSAWGPPDLRCLSGQLHCSFSSMVIFAITDGPGSVSISRMVRHSGKFRCHLYCNMPSWHHKGDKHYYPVMQCPNNYNLAGCSHPDIPSRDLVQYQSNLTQKYKKNIENLLAASTQCNYKTWCHELGLCKQTLLSGLPHCPLPCLTFLLWVLCTWLFSMTLIFS